MDESRRQTWTAEGEKDSQVALPLNSFVSSVGWCIMRLTRRRRRCMRKMGVQRHDYSRESDGDSIVKSATVLVLPYFLSRSPLEFRGT